MDRSQQLNPRSVEEVFKEFKGRRAAIIKALTTDFDELYRQCDPAVKEKLCLFGFPSERWEVNLPVEYESAELPDPLLGINFVRDDMRKKDWLCMVAIYSDVWLLAVAFYFGLKFRYDRADRSRLLNMINDLPTVSEVVSGRAKEQPKEKPSVRDHRGNNRSKSMSIPNSKSKYSRPCPKYVNGDCGLKEEEENEQGEKLCVVCNDGTVPDELWISCDICERWFHMKCVKITHSMAEQIKVYKCPLCTRKRART